MRESRDTINRFRETSWQLLRPSRSRTSSSGTSRMLHSLRMSTCEAMESMDSHSRDHRVFRGKTGRMDLTSTCLSRSSEIQIGSLRDKMTFRSSNRDREWCSLNTRTRISRWGWREVRRDSLCLSRRRTTRVTLSRVMPIWLVVTSGTCMVSKDQVAHQLQSTRGREVRWASPLKAMSRVVSIHEMATTPTRKVRPTPTGSSHPAARDSRPWFSLGNSHLSSTIRESQAEWSQPDMFNLTQRTAKFLKLSCRAGKDQFKTLSRKRKMPSRILRWRM